MNKRNRATFCMTIIIIILLIIAMGTSKGGNLFFSKNGIWSILPPLVAISLAFVTQNVVVSLFVGVLVGTFLLSIDGFNVMYAISHSFILATENMLGVLSVKWNSGIILQVLAIGGLVGLVSRLGGARAIAESLSKYAKGSISTQVITWILGLIIFFDDYANSLIVGPIMRPITDKNKVSREKLAFIVDATAAPVAGIALISTWIGAEISSIKSGLEIANITDIAPYNLFAATLPYRFYNILMLGFVLASAIMLKDFGSMLKAEKNARTGNAKISLGVKITDGQDPLLVPSDEKSSIWYAIIPLGFLIIGSFLGFYLNGRATIMAGEDKALIEILNNTFAWNTIKECFGASDASIVLFQTALLAGIIALIMGIVGKKFTLDEGINTWIAGLKSLLITAVILVLAWSLSAIISELETSAFLVGTLSDSVPKFMLPAIIFLLGAVISFATGTSYGTMGILMPLAIPFSHALSPGDYTYLLACSGAVLTGAIFGDHCSPISDTTILSSMGADCDHISHVKTQMLYAIVVAAIALLFGYIPVGLGIPVLIVLPISAAIMLATLYFIGKNPEKD